MYKFQNNYLLTLSVVLLFILGFLFFKPVFKPVFATVSSATTTVSVTVNSVLSMNTSGTVSMTVTPQPSGVQSANSDNVSVSTSNINGYTLTLSNTSNSTTSLIDGSSHNLLATPTLYTSPGILNANYWGFCTTALAGFTCPVSPFSNQTINSGLTFAKVPLLSSPVTLKTTSSTASNDVTTVWYSASLDTSQPSGVYTGVVMYTATTN